MKIYKEEVVGILLAYGILNLLTLSMWFLEGFGLYPTELNANTFGAFIADVISFMIGFLYITIESKNSSKFRAGALVAIFGTFTALITLIAGQGSWYLAVWGKYTMFIAPSLGVVIGSVVLKMLNKRL